MGTKIGLFIKEFQAVDMNLLGFHIYTGIRSFIFNYDIILFISKGRIKVLLNKHFLSVSLTIYCHTLIQNNLNT
jgi:hypothetical protein